MKFHIFTGFKQVLLLGIYIISLVQIPQSSSAPAHRQILSTMSQNGGRMDSHPKWINPCGAPMGPPGPHAPESHDSTSVVVPDVDLLTQIVNQAKIALEEAEHFKYSYAQQTFFRDFDQVHNSFHSFLRYDWLPDIPKTLRERTPLKHLQNLELNDTLLDIYEHLQKIAVGLEQVVWDQEDQASQFHRNFQDTEFKLRALLCEIQVAIYERGIENAPNREDVRRDIMTEDFRQMTDTSARHIRDFIIFREYMNALEYVIDVFDFFKEKL